MTSLDPRTSRVIRDLAKSQHELHRRVNQLHRAQDAGRTTIHRGSLNIINDNGEVTRVGKNGVEQLGGTPPEQPAAPHLESPAPGELVVTTDGDDVHGETAPGDWYRTHVHLSQDEGFEPSAGTFKTSLWDAAGSAVLSVHAGVWWVRIIWETRSGLVSEPSLPVMVEVEPPVDADDIQQVVDDTEQKISDAVESRGNRYGTEPPEDDAPDGVIYYQRNQDDEVVAVFRRDDGEWVPMPLTDAVLVSLSTDKLVAGDALIGDTLIDEDGVHARNLYVTEEMVGNLMRLLHLVVDRIDVNALWADQTWQNAGYFGSNTADFRTTVDGTGITTERNHDGTYLPVSQLGGPEQALTFWDENNEPTATVERSGDAAFQTVEATHFEHQGRPLFQADPFPWHDGPILDALPRGIVDRTPPVNMAGVSVSSRTAYGFLEVAGRVEAGRVYRVSHTPFLMGNEVAYYGEYTYTFSNTDTPPPAPHTESARLEGVRWRIVQETVGPNTGGEVTFTATENGIIRILLVVGRASSGTGITFHATQAYGNPVLTLEDVGPARRWNGRRRYATHGGSQSPDRDPVVLSQGYTTAWTPTWQQVYRGNSTSTHHSHNPISVIQGRDNAGNFYSSLLGGYQTNTAVRGDHAGLTMNQALDGRTVISGRIIAVGTSQNQTGVTTFYWHAHGQAPDTVRNDIPPPNYVGERRDRAGTVRVTQLPQDALDAINNGMFQGVTIHPVRPDGTRDLRPYHGLGGVTHDTPVTIELTYEENQ